MFHTDCKSTGVRLRCRRRSSAGNEPWTSATLIAAQFEAGGGDSCRQGKTLSRSSLSREFRGSRNRRRNSASKLLKAQAFFCGCLLSVAPVTGFGVYGTTRVRPSLRSSRRLSFDGTRAVDPEGRGESREDGECIVTFGRGTDEGRRLGRTRHRDGWGRGSPAFSTRRGAAPSSTKCRMSTVMEPPARSLENLPSSSSVSHLERSARLPESPPIEAPSSTRGTRTRGATMVRRIPFLTSESGTEDLIAGPTTGYNLNAKLLTREQEHVLGTRIQTLMKLTSLSRHLSMSLGRQPSVGEWAEACGMTVEEFKEELMVCQAAKETMVRANMRMVVSIARRYQHIGVPMVDLIQEGSIGLIRAVEKFDPKKGFKLSTYAAWWIHQAVFKGITNQSRVIRLPMHVHNLLHNVRKAQKELTLEGANPTDNEVASYLDMPVKRLKHYLGATKEAISFELPTGVHVLSKDPVLGDNVMSLEHVGVEKDMDTMVVRREIMEVLHDLSEDERTIVTLRFGLNGGKSKTVNQIADMAQASPSYVRSVEGKALRKLRSPLHQRRLQELMRMTRGASFSIPSSSSSSTKKRRSSSSLSRRE